MTDKQTTLAPREGAATAPVSINLQGAIEAAAALGKEGVEVLERLDAMDARRLERAGRVAFHEAMAELHRRVGPVAKNRIARFTTKAGAGVEYRYADLAQIDKAVREHMAELGLSRSWDTRYEDGAEIVTCTVDHVGGHSRSSTWRAPIDGGNPLTSSAQKAKIATTFAQRVTLIQALGLVDTEDDVDGADLGTEHTGEAITAEQAANLNALVEEVGANREKFVAWLGVAEIEDLPAARFSEAVRALEAKRRQA